MGSLAWNCNLIWWILVKAWLRKASLPWILKAKRGWPKGMGEECCRQGKWHVQRYITEMKSAIWLEWSKVKSRQQSVNMFLENNNYLSNSLEMLCNALPPECGCFIFIVQNAPPISPPQQGLSWPPWPCLSITLSCSSLYSSVSETILLLIHFLAITCFFTRV